MPEELTREDWELLHRIRGRVIRNRQLIIGSSLSMFVLTVVWVGFRLLFCWEGEACGPSGTTLLCVLCGLDNLVRVGLLVGVFFLARLLIDLFHLGGTLEGGGRWARVREGTKNLSGTWEPPKGSGPGMWTVILCVAAVGIALYLAFSGFETYQLLQFPEPIPLPEPS